MENGADEDTAIAALLHDAVEDANLMVAVFSLAKVAFNLEFEDLFKPFSVPLQALAWAESGEIVAMNDHTYLKLGMIEAARAG